MLYTSFIRNCSPESCYLTQTSGNKRHVAIELAHRGLAHIRLAKSLSSLRKCIKNLIIFQCSSSAIRERWESLKFRTIFYLVYVGSGKIELLPSLLLSTSHFWVMLSVYFIPNYGRHMIVLPK